MIRDDVQNLITTNLLGPMLKDQLSAARLQQQEAIDSGRSIINEIKNAMMAQQEMRQELEYQLKNIEHQQAANGKARRPVSFEGVGEFFDV